MAKMKLSELVRTARTSPERFAHVHVCSACKAEFGADTEYDAEVAFTLHRCPATPKPDPGEPWEAYQKRARAFAAAWRKEHGIRDTPPGRRGR